MPLRSPHKAFLSGLLLFIVAVSGLHAQTIKHKVQNEETLFNIAQQYDITVQQLKKWNDLEGNAIFIGQVLIIKKTFKDGTYTVKPGNTLFSIAQRFGVSVAQLKKWNNITGTAISIGDVLAVQAGQKKQIKTAAPPADVSSPQTQNASNSYYTVKSGDTLFRIAQLFGMEVEKLKALNSLTSNNIYVGQQLKVVGGLSEPKIAAVNQEAVIRYELKQGMELQELLRIFEMEKQRFRQLNPDVNNSYINKGQVVRVTVSKTKSDAIPNRSVSGLTRLGSAEVLKYDQRQKGKVTTNGELYNPKALTAAHASMAIGSVIFVKNPANGHGVIIRINDRITKKGLKLSKAARQALGITGSNANVILYRINE